VNPRTAARGQSLTEFALVIPVLIILVTGLFDFSRAMFYLNGVAEAARNGSRIALVNQDADYICAEVAEAATLLDLPPTCVAAGTSPGVTPESGAECPKLDACTQTITVKAQFTPIIPIISGVIGPIELSSASTVHIERVCPAPGELACPAP
jgi:Flp pilus assembly protein TadG